MSQPVMAALPLPPPTAVLGLPLFAWAGVLMAVLLVWQALTGLKAIKLGKRFATIHKTTGLVAVALMVFHVPFALKALGIF